MRAVIGRMYRSATRRIRVLPAASDRVRGRLESAFALPDERVPVTGEPRVDVLSRGTAEHRHSEARAAIERAAGPLGSARLVLYAPTWRDGAPDPAVPTARDWGAVVDVLNRRDAVLLVRSHPLGAGDYTPPFPTERVRDLGSHLVSDVTPLLPGLDALVTDYSSLAFDAALVPLPVVYLAPDVDAYARTRGFYGSYADVAGEAWATDWSGATTQLDAVLGDEGERARRIAASERLSERHHAFRDGRNTDRVYRAILAGLRATRPGRPTKGLR
jgi:CDP-glycerol glycerophosphotransferase